MGVEDLLDNENQVTDSDLDDDSSQCSKDWNAEAIANDPMYYVLWALIGNNDSRAYFKSIVIDQHGFLLDFWCLSGPRLSYGLESLRIP
ncbi:hypothetical protein Nepgr_020456 [Nepenthes gracilis]|uniref:Uncharacterized protein n=1 Tax=Nepenthes gracilis TaxID=150966 RepID=A0AAD3XWA7_NEPGR|nr:hypothetical protein Nepgr_020456 [Nepenthes gracilis]